MVEDQTRYVAYRFRAYPTVVQRAQLEQWQHAQRALWNSANAHRLERLKRADGYDPKRSRRFLSAFDQHVELTECRAEFEWLRAIPQMMQQDLLTQLYRSWQSYFSRKAGRPRFKRKASAGWAPLGIPARECKRISRKRVRLPKLGDLRVCGHRAIAGKPLRVEITREVDEWFVSITCELVEAAPDAPRGAPVGIDVGVAYLLADSNGTLVENPRRLECAQQRIRRAQRIVARRKPKRGQPASNNYRKATRKVALLHRKVRRQRADMLHKLTHYYAKNHGVVVIEDLHVRAMTASARGTLEEPGARARQKAGLNRSILGVGWHEIRRQLTYKCERTRALLLAVHAHNTSVRCSRCGHVDPASRTARALFVCTACGYRAHADSNAAVNIRDRGLESFESAGASPVPVCGGFAAIGQPTMQKEVCVSALVSSPVLQGGVS